MGLYIWAIGFCGFYTIIQAGDCSGRDAIANEAYGVAL